MGIIEASSGYRVRGVSIREKIDLSRILGLQDEGVATWSSGQT